ncbi:MAG: hypothetical protein WC289_05710 [Patescibacteria group bacterium]|jgi:Tfp pilus assembly protein PilN
MTSGINLLPSTDKEKRDEGSHAKPVIIEMTHPDKFVAKKAEGGVLQFFKQAFRKPVEPKQDKQPSGTRSHLFQQKPPKQPIVHELNQVKFVKKESSVPSFSSYDSSSGVSEGSAALRNVSVPPRAPAPSTQDHAASAPKKELLQLPAEYMSAQKQGPGVFQRFGMWIRKIFASSPKPTTRVTAQPPRIPPPPVPPAIAQAAAKPERLTVFVPPPVSPKPSLPPKPVAQPHGPSVFARFGTWLRRLFARKPKTFAPTSSLHNLESMPPTPKPPVKPVHDKVFTPTPTPPPSAPVVPPILPHAIPPQPKPMANIPVIPPKKEVKVESTEGTYTQAPVIDKLGMRSVNLIPGEMLEAAGPERKLFKIGFLAAICVVIVFAGYLTINLYQRTIIGETAEIDNSIANVRAEISTFSEFRASAQSLQQHIRDVNTLLDQHINWTVFFSELELHTLPDVYFTTISVNATGNVTLSAIGESPTAIAKQYTLLQHSPNFASEVSVTSFTPLVDELSGETSGYMFTISLTVPSSLFLEKKS